MTSRRIAIYFAWDRPSEVAAPLGVIDDRFPALFETRRILYPHYEELADPERFDQGIGGFIDQILRRNFAAFIEQASLQTGRSVIEAERGDGGLRVPLDNELFDKVDTVIVISFDSLRTHQQASADEIEATRRFLSKPGNLLFVCPHHDIGEADDLPEADRTEVRTAHFLHHGDRTIPPRQGFGGFARSLLAGLGIDVENRFGLHPASEPDGSPSPIEVMEELDRLGLLTEVETFNLHPHLPHFERSGEATDAMEVLARQRIDLSAPSHSFTRNGRSSFDALLQSRAGVFAGDLLIGDATLWSSTAGGLSSLQRFWSNVAMRGDG